MLDANDQLFDSQNNIAACPTGWTVDNPPTSVVLNLTLGTATWTLAGVDNTTDPIYGFQVVLSVQDDDLTAIEGNPVYVKVNANYYNTVYRTYWNSVNVQFSSPEAGIAMAGTAATLTFSGVTPVSGKTYRLQVRTLNLDGVYSSYGNAATFIAP